MNMARSRRFPVAIVVLAFSLVASWVHAADSIPSTVFAPVQGGFTTAAETSLPFAADRLLVQIRRESYARSELTLPMDKGSRAASAVTGLASFDALAADAGILSIERPYERPADAAKAAQAGVDRWFLLRFENPEDLVDLAEEFRALPEVQAVSLDWVAYPAAVPSDPLYPDHWGHNNTAQLPDLDWGGTYGHTLPTTVGTPGFDANAQAAWDASQGYGSAGVVIAILDSGVDIDHPDLRLVTGYDFGSGDSNPDDNSASPGHGTACAGVAAAVNNGTGAVGIAAGCSIMPCKVANNAGTMYFSSIQSALYWAADNGADIISMSLGAAISSDPATDSAIQYAYNAGVTILAATGNENASTISYPANNAYVIGVGAASPCGDRKRSSSSPSEVNPGVNTDPRGYTCDGERWWGSNYGTNSADAAGAVDILAPTILPTTDIGGNGGYTSGDYEPFFNGTSCATPYAAGVAALIKSANPSYTPAQVRDALVGTAQDIVNVESGAGWDRYSGYGMVDAAAAVGGGGPTPPTAAFVGSPTSGTIPLTVSFTDQSTGSPTTWSWTFGDGGTSTAQNPDHTYTSAGTYTVSLTVTNAAGSDGFTRNGYISVGTPPPPTAAFSGAPTVGTYPLAVSFTDESSGAPTSWSWTFGDGGTSTLANPSHTYTAAGTYTVTLDVTNAYGSDSLTRTNYVTVNEPGSGSWTTITYDDFESGLGSYADGGSDMSRYTGGTYAHQGSAAADIQDNSGVASSFYHSSGHDVSGYTDLEVEFWFVGVSMENNEDFWVQYFDGSAWQTVAAFAQGSDFVNNQFYNVVVSIPRSQYAYPANAQLRFLCDASGNSDDVYIDEIEFRGFGGGGGPTAPVADFTADVTTGTAPLTVAFTDMSTGSPTSWSWQFGDGGTSTQQNPNHTYSSAGTYTVTLTATNAGGSDPETKTDYITVTTGGGSGTWQTITYDDFESGMGTYADGGSDMSRYTGGTYAWQGSAAADIQDNSGTASSFYHAGTYNVSGYVDLEVDFYFRAVSMEAGENFFVEYYDGAAWRVVADFAQGSDFSNNLFYHATVGIPSSSFNYPTNARLRFRCDASSNSDDVYIDQIEFRGLTPSGAGSDPVILADVRVLPSELSLEQNSPNPFRPSTQIAFSLPGESSVRLVVFNVLGQEVARLAEGVLPAGRHAVTWDARRLPSGVYFYRLEGPGFSQTRKMTLLK
jgi:PKD repeat protein